VGPPPKSILKPTIPLSPLKPIPTRKNVNGGKQTGSPTRSKSLSLASQQLIHESDNVLALSAGPSTNEGKSATVSPETTQLAPNKGQARQSPSSDESAVRDVLDEVGERRRKEKEDIIKQRDIRRKSLGPSPPSPYGTNSLLIIRSEPTGFICPRSHLAHLERP